MNARIPPQNQPQGGGNMNLQQAVAMATQALQQTGFTPEQAVRSMLQNGSLTRQQFDNYSAQANQAMGQKR